MKYKKPESVLVVLYDQYHRVLIMQRSDDPSFWQSVTGTLEEGESPAQTALREVFEETGITLCGIEQLVDCHQTNRYEIRKQWLHRYPPGTQYNTEYVFCACVDSSVPVILSEHEQALWLPKADAITKLWSPSNRDAVMRFVPEG